MADIALFHHAQGLTPGMVAFADELRAAQHTVHTPDLFDGRTFPTLDEGIGYARSVGFDTILDRGVAAGEALRPNLVYLGFSMGVMPAQKLAQTRAGARGALLIDACMPVDEFPRLARGVPVQVHGMDHDRSSPTRATWTRRGRSSSRRIRQSYSSIRATSISSPTHRSRPTTRPPRSC